MVVPVVMATVAGSFAVAVLQVAWHPAAVFYLLPARAWELALGGAVACGVVRLPGGRGVREGAAALGLGMILMAVGGFDRSMGFPEVAMLVPCLGAVLVILAGMEGGRPAACRLLSVAPVVVLGRISYSLYLWHWPLLVARNGHGLTLGGGSRLDSVAVMVVGIGLAWMTWRFVEQPFRTGRFLPGRRGAFGGAAGAGGDVQEGGNSRF